MSDTHDGPTTRERLLAAGVELMLDRPIGTGLQHVKATEVSRRAGLSHGAFYHHWSSQEEYQEELLEHVLDLGRHPHEAQSFIERVAHADTVGATEAVRASMNAGFAEADLVPWRLWVALVARNDPDIDRRIEDRYREISDAYAPAVVEVFARLGLRPRSPVDLDRLTILVDALWEGLALRHAVAPDLIDGRVAQDRNGDDWSLYALGVALMVVGAMEPESDSPTDLLDAIDRLAVRARE